jgi:hypothetical protein
VEVVGILVSSALVSAVVGAIAGHWSQRRLASHQALVDYEATARLRLYEALGPIRFQLLIAARDVVRRVRPHHEQAWNLNVTDYYASSFVYRLLRPLALAELVSRQMAIVDFSVDPAARDLIRFEMSAYRMLTSYDPLPYHRHLDWAHETQHVFRDNLRLAASALIVSSPEGPARVVDYSQFLEHGIMDEPELRSLRRLFGGCDRNLTEIPVWWVRVVGYAYACSSLVESQGRQLGFGPQKLDVQKMIGAVSDPEIAEHVAEYPAIFDRVLAEPL